MSGVGIQSISDNLQSTAEGMVSVMLVTGLIAFAFAIVVFSMACARGQRLGPSLRLLFLASFLASAPLVLSVFGNLDAPDAVAHASSVPSSSGAAPGEPVFEVPQEPPAPPQTWEAGGSID